MRRAASVPVLMVAVAVASACTGKTRQRRTQQVDKATKAEEEIVTPNARGSWPRDGVVIDGGRLSLADAHGIAHAIRDYFAAPEVVERYGAQLARSCGRAEPFVPEQGYVRLGRWVMSTMRSAQYTLDLGHASGFRTWIQVSLERSDADGAWRVTASSRGHAHIRR